MYITILTTVHSHLWLCTVAQQPNFLAFLLPLQHVF